MLHDGVKQGVDLLDHLLSWGKAQAGRVKHAPIHFNLGGLVSQDIEFVSHTADRKGISISSLINDQIVLYADPNMISTVVRNLLTNALKFTPRGCSVVVTAKKASDCFSAGN